MTTRILSGLTAMAVVIGFAPAASAQTQMAANPKVEIATSKGNIIVELRPDKAPVTVKNFLEYVRSGFYNGTVFHRVIKGFMVQGGGFTADMKKKDTKAPIKLEAGNGLSNERGTIAMARTAARDSATSQFFLNHADNKRLDNYGGGYAVFGKVVKGLDVIDKIAEVATKRHAGHANVPTETITITSIKVVK